MNGRRRHPAGALVMTIGVTLSGGCSGSDPSPDVAAVVEGTKIRSDETEALLQGRIANESAQPDKHSHEFDDDRKRTVTGFVLLYQIKHALLRHLARQMHVAVEPSGSLSIEAEAGRLSHAMAQRLFPDVAPPTDAPADKAVELVDQQRQRLFADWFDKQLRTADISVSKPFGRWDAGRVVQ